MRADTPHYLITLCDPPRARRGSLPLAPPHPLLRARGHVWLSRRCAGGLTGAAGLALGGSGTPRTTPIDRGRSHRGHLHGGRHLALGGYPRAAVGCARSRCSRSSLMIKNTSKIPPREEILRYAPGCLGIVISALLFNSALDYSGNSLDYLASNCNIRLPDSIRTWVDHA